MCIFQVYVIDIKELTAKLPFKVICERILRA